MRRGCRHAAPGEHAAGQTAARGAPPPPRRPPRSPSIADGSKSPCAAGLGLLAHGVGLAHRAVDGREDHVLQQLDVLRVDRVRVGRDGVQQALAGRDDLDHAPAGGGLHAALVLELVLRGGHLLLHLLGLLEHLVEVGRQRHQLWVSSDWSVLHDRRVELVDQAVDQLVLPDRGERVLDVELAVRAQLVGQAQGLPGDGAHGVGDDLAVTRAVGGLHEDRGRLRERDGEV